MRKEPAFHKKDRASKQATHLLQGASGAAAEKQAGSRTDQK